MNVDVIALDARDDARREAVAWFDDITFYVPRDKLGMLAGGFDKPQALLKALKGLGILDRPNDRWHHNHVPRVGSGLPHYRLWRRTLLGGAEEA